MATKNLVLALILVAVMFSCNLSSRTAPPTSINLSGAQALYLQAGGGAKSITAPDGAILMKLLNDATTGQAIFEDAGGKQVTVTVNRTLQLTPEYLLLDFSYADGQLTALVTLATGELRALPADPDTWNRIRVKGGIAYYTASGNIYRLDLATLDSKIMNDGVGAQHQGGTLIVVNPNDCVFAFTMVDGNGWPNTNNKFFVYYQDGSTPVDITGSSGAMLFLLLYAGDYGDRIVEDQATQDIYLLTFQAAQLVSQRMQFHDDGFIYVDPEQIIPAWTGGAAVRLSSASGGYPYLHQSLWGRDKTVARLGASGGQIVAEVFAASEGYFNEAVNRAGDVYYADRNQYVPGIRRYQLGAVLTETQVVTETVAGFEVVKGQLFYSTASGTYRHDIAGGTTEFYSADPAEILAVTE